MKPTRISKAITVGLACLGMITNQIGATASTPLSSRTARTAGHQSSIIDIALGSGGQLMGRVNDDRNRQVGQSNIVIRQGNKVVARTTSNRDGHFSVRGLRGGVYQVQTGNSQAVYRFWSANTAPPAAKIQLQLTAGHSVVRAQNLGMPPQQGTNVLYDANGNPYGRVRIMDPAFANQPMPQYNPNAYQPNPYQPNPYQQNPMFQATYQNEPPNGNQDNDDDRELIYTDETVYYDGWFGGGFLGGLDLITTTTVAAAVAAATISAINMNHIHDLEDKIDQLLASP